MIGYKVLFNNNSPYLAQHLNAVDYSDVVKYHVDGEKRYMDHHVVFADDEEDALNQASSILKNYWSKFLGAAN